MARMIPPQVHSDCVSAGEREVFVRLRDDPATAEWTVLHSLDVAKHRQQVSGEIDFLVIIPGSGVLCLEIKACRELRRENGMWYYGTATTGDPRGPFKQASTAMHSMRERVGRNLPALQGVVFWSAVVFPYLNFVSESPEWHSWQVIDQRALSLRPLSQTLVGVLDRARVLLANSPSARWFDAATVSPTVIECEALVKLLRPDFESYMSPKARVQQLDATVKKYTDEQLSALDAMAANERVLFEGPAGTGKTLLAIESARRAAESGRKVLFLCFNRLLGTWLEDQMAPHRARVTTATFHKHLLGIVATEGPPHDPTSDYWERTLPTQAIERLTRGDDAYVFDEVILDEAQDLLRDEYLDVLDLSLRGGLSAGRWRFYGDFENQSIYAMDRGEALVSRLADRAGLVPRFGLRTNCRNTPRIAELVHVLGGLVPRYARVLRPDDGVEPTVLYYRDADEQRRLLDSAISDFSKSGLRGNDIVILSPRAQNACAAIAGNAVRERFRPFGVAHSNTSAVGFCSIHSFKGLESRAVIVTDVEEVGTAQAMTLFYVATTRALHRLTILAHERVRAEARSLVRQQLSGVAVAT